MKITAVKCSDCGEIVYSRANHDFNTCSCFTNEINGTGVFIDGGPNGEYIRYGWSSQRPELIDIEIDATKEELYTDWNKGYNKFGKVNK